MDGKERAKTIRILVAVALLAGVPSMSAAQAEFESWRGMTAFLCEWRHRNVPKAGTPPELRSCEHASTMTNEQVFEDFGSWWNYWYSSDLVENAGILRSKFNTAYIEHQNAQDRTAARKRAAAARAKKEKEIEATAQQLEPMKLCDHVSSSKSKAARAELQRRKLFTPREWTLIDAQQIAIGMSELALRCSWGNTKANRTVTAAGERKQYVYGNASRTARSRPGRIE